MSNEAETPDRTDGNLSTKEALEIVWSERAYQQFLIKTGELPNPDKSVGEYYMLLSHYVQRGSGEWVDGNKEAMKTMRKVAAIAVACMEQHGNERLVNEAFREYLGEMTEPENLKMADRRTDEVLDRIEEPGFELTAESLNEIRTALRDIRNLLSNLYTKG